MRSDPSLSSRSQLLDVIEAIQMENHVSVFIKVERGQKFRVPDQLFMAIGVASMDNLAEGIIEGLDQNQ